MTARTVYVVAPTMSHAARQSHYSRKEPDGLSVMVVTPQTALGLSGRKITDQDSVIYVGWGDSNLTADDWRGRLFIDDLIEIARWKA